MEHQFSEDLFTEASLSDSVIYQTFNRNAEMTSTILSTIKNSVVIDSSYIEEQIIQIKRTRISPLVKEVLAAFQEGNISLLYAKNKKVPQAFPFFATKMNGKVKVIIFVNNYGTISKSDSATDKMYLNISMKNLYVLMEGAYIAYKYNTKPIDITKNLGLMKLSVNIYVNLLLRILNKECSISNDMEAYNKVAFCIGKFFLERVWMSTNEDIIFTYACSTINSVINKAEMMIISKMYDDKQIKTIDQLISFLREITPRLSGMSFRYFLQCFINTYKDGALFSLECLPYFLYVIEASMIGSFLINQPMISDICKNIKGMNSFYPELVKSVS